MVGGSFPRNSWLVTLPLALIVAGYLACVWWPKQRAFQAAEEQLTAKRQFVARATPWAAALVEVRRKLEQAETAVTQWEANAPQKRTLPSLFGKINSLAKTAGLSVNRFDPQPWVAYEKIREIPLNIGGVGEFAQCFEFLRSLEGLPPSIWVEVLKIERNAQNTKNTKIDVVLEVFSDKL